MTILWALVLSLILTAPATAAPITFAFTGIINSAPISGSYTFESTAPLNDNFTQGTGRVSLTGGGWMFSPAPLGLGQWAPTAAQSITAATLNWNGQQGTENLAVLRAYDPHDGSSGVTADGWLYAATIHVQGLTGYDYFGLTLEGLGAYERLSVLPAVPPSLNLAQSARLELFNQSTGAFVQGQLNSLTLAPVPLPPAVLLFGAGLIALVGLGARNWRRG